MDFLEMKYHGTYYYCNIIKNITNNSFDYLNNLEQLFANNYILNFVAPFRKESNLHEFIYFLIDRIFIEEYSRLNKYNCRSYFPNISTTSFVTPLENAFKSHDIKHVDFMTWSKINHPNKDIEDDFFEEYYEDMMEYPEYWDLIKKLGEDIFYILFLNRAFLKDFNELFSGYLHSCFGNDELLKEVESDGILGDILKPDFKVKRKYIPTWVQKAVFFRDRGRCVQCHTDLSGLVSTLTKKNFDHIVPLNLYGFNDISNIQLMCQKCNKEKSGQISITSHLYERWYK